MQIESAIQLYAGGPGSGRHKMLINYLDKSTKAKQLKKLANDYENRSKKFLKDTRNAKSDTTRSLYQKKVIESREIAESHRTESEKLNKEAKESLKDAQHRDFGKFGEPENNRTVGGNSKLFKSPSGDLLRTTDFSGFSIQKVASNYGFELTSDGNTFSKEWSGVDGRSKRNEFVKKYFGVNL